MKRNRKPSRTSTRKQRKQERKLKKFTKNLTDNEKTALKKVAREMSKQDNPLIGIRFFCKTCDQSWEYAHDNILVYCREYHYFNCCLKEVREFRTCPKCEVCDEETANHHQRHFLDGI